MLLCVGVCTVFPCQLHRCSCIYETTLTLKNGCPNLHHCCDGHDGHRAERQHMEAYFTEQLCPLLRQQQTMQQLHTIKKDWESEQQWHADAQGIAAGSPNISSQQQPEEEEEEMRIDVEDGQAYTKAEFIEAYGGTAEWDMSSRAAPPAPAPAPAPTGPPIRTVAGARRRALLVGLRCSAAL